MSGAAEPDVWCLLLMVFMAAAAAALWRVLTAYKTLKPVSTTYSAGSETAYVLAQMGEEEKREYVRPPCLAFYEAEADLSELFVDLPSKSRRITRKRHRDRGELPASKYVEDRADWHRTGAL